MAQEVAVTREQGLELALRAVSRELRSPASSANAAIARSISIIGFALDHRRSDPYLFVNAERTVLVRSWESGRVEAALRDHESHIWGAPIELVEERSFVEGRS